MKPLLLSLLIAVKITCIAQTGKDVPSYKAVRISSAPTINGILDDEVWQLAEPTDHFTQRNPDFNTAVKYKTEVRILYDDKAIYIGAVMFDNNPDSIKKELAVRDSEGINADYFYIGFDTWNNKQDAYIFGVSASGVQVDKRAVDETYDAVWASSIKINEQGWIAEFRIPYSALRFPSSKEQVWGMQIVRQIRRNREEDQWSLEPRDTDNTLNYWGTLTGLQDIDPPLRLSLMPYLSAGIQHNGGVSSASDKLSYNYNGGMDLKWGLNESFTLDMILLPDFSQVQSDEIQKNLSPFEIVYDENRPFFNEGTDLFQKGGLFYSRRIGHVPVNYYSANDSLQEGERLVKNPFTSRLINAVKVSGRTSKGLGVGIFNAITGNTYAVLADSNDKKREILTDPLTNYNIIVLDLSLPNNSSIYLINTNVTRPDGWKRSNVGGGGFKFSEKSNTYQLVFDLSLSSIHQPINQSENSAKKRPGAYYNIEFQKTKGKFRFSLYQIKMDERYNKNDMGVNNTNDWLDRGLTLGYNIFEPFGIFRNFYQSVNFFREEKATTQENINSTITYRFNTTFTNYLSFWGTIACSPYDRFDYYEPRLAGRYWLNPGYNTVYLGISSDYRKAIALDGEFEFTRDLAQTSWDFYSIQPIIRFSDKFKVVPNLQLQFGKDDKGFASIRNDSVFFANRDIQTITTAISGEYLFNNKISISLRVRHYWQKGEYKNFFLLSSEGHLLPFDNYTTNHNYNYNYFNVDLVFGWEFSPGSMLNIVWKNAIETENDLHRIKYSSNFDKMISSPQLNNLSIKALYYLDYQMLKRKKK